jgi:hypothetical protein
MTNPFVLGQIELPEGILIVLDPGYARYWRHDGDPASPRPRDPREWDLEIVGKDAVAAGRAYDRQWNPRFLYDIPNVDAARQHFRAFATEHGLDADVRVLPARVPHTARVHDALKVGEGLAVVPYNSLWSVAVGGLPVGRPLDVIAQPMPAGEFEGRWEWMDVVIDAAAPVHRSDGVNGFMVDYGQILFAGLGPLGAFRMWESLDGLADFVFRGRDAEALAKTVGANRLSDHEFGWLDVPDGEIGARAKDVQARIERDDLGVSVDYRPHCNLERLNAQVRTSELEIGTLVLNGARVLGGSNSWGDGIFRVSRLFDQGGRLVRVRVELGTEQRQARLRKLAMLARGAVVSRAIVDDDEPIRFSQRDEPRNERDSGWMFFAGTESEEYVNDPDNLAIVQLGTLIERFPALEETLTAPVGARFRLEGDRYVDDSE